METHFKTVFNIAVAALLVIYAVSAFMRNYTGFSSLLTAAEGAVLKSANIYRQEAPAGLLGARGTDGGISGLKSRGGIIEGYCSGAQLIGIAAKYKYGRTDDNPATVNICGKGIEDAEIGKIAADKQYRFVYRISTEGTITAVEYSE